MAEKDKKNWKTGGNREVEIEIEIAIETQRMKHREKEGERENFMKNMMEK